MSEIAIYKKEPHPAVAAVVGVAKAHRAVVEAAQALVADGDPVGVAAEVVEDLFGTGEGPLGVDDLFGLEEA